MVIGDFYNRDNIKNMNKFSFSFVTPHLQYFLLVIFIFGI